MPFGPPTHPVGCNYTFSYQGLCCESVVAISTLSVLALGSEYESMNSLIGGVAYYHPPLPPKHVCYDSSLKCTPDHVRDMVSTWTLQLHAGCQFFYAGESGMAQGQDSLRVQKKLQLILHSCIILSCLQCTSE